jgi:hypothetical protein
MPTLLRRGDGQAGCAVPDNIVIGRCFGGIARVFVFSRKLELEVSAHEKAPSATHFQQKYRTVPDS